jgi:DNA invertase Pin-like site-specific DNA recombinase
MPAATRVVGYFRKSDEDDGDSIDQQREWARRLCAEEGMELVREFADQAKAGWDTGRRAAFHEMLDFCKDQKRKGTPVGAVVCWKANRFSRADSQETAWFIWEFRKAGTGRMRTASRWIDFARMEDRLVFNIEQDCSHHPYVVSLAEDVARGKAAAAKLGRFNGGPTPLAYRKVLGADGKPRLVLGPAGEVELVRWMFETYAGTPMSFRAIADELTRRGVPTPTGRREWSKDTVAAIIANPVYLGRAVWNRRSEGHFAGVVDARAVLREGTGKRVPNPPSEWLGKDGTHEPVVTIDLFERCQAKMASRRAVRKKDGKRAGRRPGNAAYLLTGLLRCGHCGGAMVGQTKAVKKGGGKVTLRIYLCSRYLRGGKEACSWNGVDADRLGRAILRKLRSVWLSRDVLEATREEIRRQDQAERSGDPARLESLRGRLAALERQLEQAADRVLKEEDESLLPALRQRMKAVLAQRDALAADVAALERAEPSAAVGDAEAEVDAALALAGRLEEAMNADDVGLLRAVLQETLSYVEVLFTHRPWGKKTRCEFARALVYRRPLAMCASVTATRSCC